MSTKNEIDDYIEKAAEEQIPLLEAVRLMIHKAVPGTEENIKWGFPVFAKNGDYAYLRHSKKHVTLGFYHIDKIDDPDGILEGSGKTLAHVKIRSKEDIRDTLFSTWLKSVSA